MLKLFRIDDFSNLKSKDVIVFGASTDGEKIQEVCRENGIEIKYFCDNNNKLWGKFINGTEVISVHQLIEYCNDNVLKAVIQIGCKYDDEIEKQLLSAGIKSEVYYNSEFWVIFRRYIEYKNIDLYIEKNMRSKIREKLKFEESLIDIILRKKQGIREGEIYMKYSAPKVANTSIIDTVEYYKKNIFNAGHTLGGFDEITKKRVKSEVKKIITGIREPISQNLSNIYQEADVLHYFLEYEECRDAQEVFLKMVLEKNERNDECIMFQKNLIQNWFDERMKKELEIDVYNYDFDTEKGYSIIHKDGVEILLYRMENIKELSDVFGEFLKIDNFQLQTLNDGNSKWYAKSYKNFIKNIELPKEYVEKVYNGKFMKHFYSESEIKKFRDKWSQNIVKTSEVNLSKK
ncbi:putative capsular polysaccharide synthesis family protein [Clostridium beijerinckii]|uniref:Putative capsular polysaccharide synthesis protein n=1 Tax=Clostridium beijerinckii TaxID=1520 RepID=A0A1S8S609_CLOBE|nr:putative capsular polysaccharide synthesis family protein [Clostridium beijerinckii]NRY60054.1 hypothetical protein [Clostridium beijerinckii]OOM60910.1 putative capsular polysaccharide synthesis protein [Clostridium beijerinckii]